MNNEKLKKLGKENLIAAAFGIGTGAVEAYAKLGANASDTVVGIIIFVGFVSIAFFVRDSTWLMLLSFFIAMMIGMGFAATVYEALGIISRP